MSLTNPILYVAGGQTHRGSHEPTHHVQRVPADGAGKGRHAQERSHPPQGGILQGIQQVRPECIQARNLYCNDFKIYLELLHRFFP
jgi:hypothetical protein